ncbi:hypothetical protein QAD02_024331 [Eretmocerus hayati]|uniref:Uncharacterized protein n=1 Tax=Eretmocerus hayati TaxID=131215 RepID=A0ACC2PYB4_9HYME|nr:hypothetical protein QAD02_024331 [Eretmocerus hayati]
MQQRSSTQLDSMPSSMHPLLWSRPHATRYEDATVSRNSASESARYASRKISLSLVLNLVSIRFFGAHPEYPMSMINPYFPFECSLGWCNDLMYNEPYKTLHETIWGGDDPEPIRCAIREGFDVNERASWFFFFAILRGRQEIVRTMLEAGVDRDAVAQLNIERISPMTVACACIEDKQLRHKMVQFLLEYGISLEFDPSRHTESCVHAALDYADCELLELLARSGADLNCLDRVSQIHRVNGESDGGNTPLHRVVLGIVAYLTRPWNADVSAKFTSV